MESKIYLGHIVQNGLVYKDEGGAWERGNLQIALSDLEISLQIFVYYILHK